MEHLFCDCNRIVFDYTLLCFLAGKATLAEVDRFSNKGNLFNLIPGLFRPIHEGYDIQHPDRI